MARLGKSAKRPDGTVLRRLLAGPRSLLIVASALVLMGLTSLLVTAAASVWKPSPNAKALACERTQKICNRAAWRALPMRTPDAAGSTLMTETQAIAAVGWQRGDQVGAQEMTYGQATSAYPDLAGEEFIDQARVVWVITLYFPTPVQSSWAPPPGFGAASSDFSSATIVIDAATGTETDWCEGCSTIPASAAALTAASASQPAARRARAITASAVRTTITIDPHLGETFAPPPSTASPPLTAQQSWAQFIQSSTVSSGGTAIPSTVTAQLGLFTLPIGPDCGATCSGDPVQNGIAYRSLNQLAYGYSWDGGTCGGSNPVNPAPPVPCTEWLFIDANTGHMIVWTVQLQPATP
jgi:hypothetical protein